MVRLAFGLAACLALLAGWSADVEPTPGGLLLVANKGDHALGIIDPVAGRQVATVLESGITGHEVAASADGRLAFVPIYGDSGVGRPGSDGRTIDVIDLVRRERVATLDLGRPERPHCPQLGPDGRLYVTTELTSDIAVIDPLRHEVVERIPTGQKESHMLVLSPDGRSAFVSNVGAGTVSVVDVRARRVAVVLPVAPVAQRIALSPDGRWAFTADQKQPRLIVIDAALRKVARSVALPAVGYGTAPTPDGRWLLAALPGAAAVAVVDLRSWAVSRTLEVPRAPQAVLVRPDGAVAYVSCDASGTVAEIDLAHWTVSRLITAGRMADGLAWAKAPR
ncbi:MAG TPA: hypothetical protein VEQ10_12455 [Vicinamibacteria bacterium]|nr:hypothetical protein [Vicinamibacteria bacterium]